MLQVCIFDGRGAPVKGFRKTDSLHTRGNLLMPPRKGTPNRRGIARREQILDAAVELFAHRGYRGAGLLALGERVGMSHVGILRHFGTKEDLLRAVMARRDELLATIPGIRDLRMLQEIPIPFEPEILTRLATVLRAENFEPDAPLHDYFEKSHQQARDSLAAWLRAAQERGEIRNDIDPDVKAVEIMAFGIGLETQWLLSPHLVDRAKARDSWLRALFYDLMRPDAPRKAKRKSSRPKRAADGPKTDAARLTDAGAPANTGEPVEGIRSRRRREPKSG